MSGGKCKEEKKFAQLSPDTVHLIADTLGFGHLDPRVARALAEDASYRCREIANVCAQVLKHSKRRRLTTRDVEKAFEWSDVDPVLGHDNGNDPQDFIPIIPDASAPDNKSSLFHVAQERIIELRPFALGQSPPVVAAEPGIQAVWLALEGHFCPENEEPKQQPADLPQQSNLSPPLVQYYQALSHVILGDSEEMIKTMVSDVATNPKIGALLPFLVCFIRNGIQRHCDNTLLMGRLLYLLQAVFSNTSVNLSPKPYLSHLVTALLSSLIVDRPVKEPPRSGKRSFPNLSQTPNLTLNIDHVQQASQILRQVLDRWATPVNQLRSQTHRALREYLKDDKISHASHYGALSAMIALGPAVLEECLLPQLETYIRSTAGKMKRAEDEAVSAAASFDPATSKEAIMENQKQKCVLNLMWGTLAAAARILLKHHSGKLPPPERIKVEHGSTPSLSASEVYDLLAENFGDSLTMATATELSQRSFRGTFRKESVVGKLRIRKLCDSDRVNRGGSGEPRAVSGTTFGVGGNFSLLADLGMPHEIFDPGFRSDDVDGSPYRAATSDETEDKMFYASSGGADAVMREFELERGTTVVGCRKITVELTNCYRWPPDKLRPRRTKIHPVDSRNERRSAAIGKRMGTCRKGFWTEAKLSSCCIYSVF